MAQITLNQPIAEIHGALSKPRPLFFESVCSFSQITFGYLSYYPATCFAFASILANIPAFTLYTLYSTQKNRPPRRFFLHNPNYFYTFVRFLIRFVISLNIHLSNQQNTTSIQ